MSSEEEPRIKLAKEAIKFKVGDRLLFFPPPWAVSNNALGVYERDGFHLEDLCEVIEMKVAKLGSLNMNNSQSLVPLKGGKLIRQIKRKGDLKMTTMEKARVAGVECLKTNLNVEDVRVIGITKMDDGWQVEAEVYEESSFIKSLGLSTRVQDRNIYAVKLNDSLEVESYERHGHPALAE